MTLDWSAHPSAAARDAHLADALAGLYVGPPRRGPLAGGRAAALDRLHRYDAARYGRTRNFVDAPVSRLSPYLRHGMVSAAEVRDHLRERYKGSPELVEEFLRQLAWRDFFAHVLDWHGPAVDDDLEEPKHAVRRLPLLPADVADGRTGLPCVDGMLAELFDDGYLHNHERLWFAAYLCHFRGVSWKAGARLFRQHLYDGDRASNACSWQWVEGTFAAKPYFMNKDNIAKFSGGRWCRDCRAVCPFDADYDALQRKLFAGATAPLAGQNRAEASGGREPPEHLRNDSPSCPPRGAHAPRSPMSYAPRSPGVRCPTVLWAHDAALSPDDVALTAHPDAAVVFVFDEPALRAEPWAFHRLAFVFDGVCELFAALPQPVKVVRVGDPAAELAAVATEVGATTVALTDNPDPAVRGAADALRDRFDVRSYPRPKLAEYADEPRRFSRYWDQVSRQVLGYPAKFGQRPR